MKRGRPVADDLEIRNTILRSYKEMLNKDGKTLPRADPLWKKISDEITLKTGVKKTISALYIHVNQGRSFEIVKPANDIDNEVST